MDFSKFGESQRSTPIYYSFSKTGDKKGLLKKVGTNTTEIEKIAFLPLSITAKTNTGKKGKDGFIVNCKMQISETETADLTVCWLEELEIKPNTPNFGLSLLECLMFALDNKTGFQLECWTKPNPTGSEKLGKECFLVDGRFKLIVGDELQEAKASCFNVVKEKTETTKEAYQKRYDFQKKDYKPDSKGNYKASQLEEFWTEIKAWLKPYTQQ